MPKSFTMLPLDDRINSGYTVDSSGCWVWLRSKSGHGYVEIWDNKKRLKLHRYMYEQKYGMIPEGLVIDHLCRVRHCINPDHLEAVTIQENVLRGDGLSARHSRQTHCKRGHEFNKDNTRRSPKGGRHCKECARQYYQTVVKPKNRAKIRGGGDGV